MEAREDNDRRDSLLIPTIMEVEQNGIIRTIEIRSPDPL